MFLVRQEWTYRKGIRSYLCHESFEKKKRILKEKNLETESYQYLPDVEVVCFYNF